MYRSLPKRCRDAFTLVEVLIVSVLLSVLMLAVWAMLRNWSGLYERGERLTREAQLARALCDQLTDDLQSVTYRTPPRTSRRARRGNSRDATAVALVGEKDWMVLDVLRPVNPYLQAARTSEQAESDPSAEEQMQVRSPELQRIIYRFQSRGDSLDALPEDENPTFYGLVRLAIAREYLTYLTTLDTASDTLVGRRATLKDTVVRLCDMVTNPETTEGEGNPAPTTDAPADFDTEAPPDMGRPIRLAGVIEQDEIPEIGWLEIRYFDGTAWVDAWNSPAQGRLPVAVEIRFQIIELPPEDELELSDEEKAEKLLEPSDEEPTDDEAILEGERPEWADQADAGDLSGLDSDEPPPYHRVVIYLQPPKQWPAAAGASESDDTGPVSGEGEPER